jgi:prolyl-tRNA synthetase
MFDIVVESPDKTLAPADRKVHVYQNSWGLSTRIIGVMVMIHGDDQGLVLPPRVALQQVAIVPVGLSKKEDKNEEIYDACSKLEKELLAVGIRAKADLREGYTPGWKFNDWEMRVGRYILVATELIVYSTLSYHFYTWLVPQGVPLRLELGPRDIAANTVLTVRRYDNHKSSLPLTSIGEAIKSYLEEIHHDMLARAQEKFDASFIKITNWDDVVPTLDNKKALVLPWCEREVCEDAVKDRSKSQWVLRLESMGRADEVQGE